MIFFFNDTATTEIYTLSLHDALPICAAPRAGRVPRRVDRPPAARRPGQGAQADDLPGPGAHPHLPRGDRPEEHRRSEEHTSELQSRQYLVCRLLLEKKNIVRHELPSL